MMDLQKLCKGCMKHTYNGTYCSNCGFSEEEYKAPLHQLRTGTILAGKYILGKAIGEGGFGITYIGLDINLNMRVAIKEFFPAGCVTRNASVSDTITVFSGKELEYFNHGRDKFMEEAQIIAQFDSSDGIVSVKDFFLENGTAYIVMEYIDGEDLKAFLKRTGTQMNVHDALNTIKPVLESLSQLHRQGLIHRDISPDNIKINSNGRVKLIDFGAARDINIDGNKSLSIQLKPGYAPEEQYRSHGKQGPWTDVYALCATIYRMITGVVPVEALERVRDDKLLPPSKLGVQIPPHIESTLMAGLSVDYQNRIQTVEELYNAFYNNEPVVARAPQKQNKKATDQKVIIGVLVAAAVVCIPLLLFVFNAVLVGNNIGFDELRVEETATPTVAPTEAPTPTPTVMIARADRYSYSAYYKRMDNIHNSWLTDDATYMELKAVILDFDEKCLRYVNEGDSDIFQYLKPGSKAYQLQTDYKNADPNVHETLHWVNVINSRYDGTSYYVWVDENRTVSRKGTTKTQTDSWVYRLIKNSDGYEIVDYITDPV